MSTLYRINRLIIIAALALVSFGYGPASSRLRTAKATEQTVPQDTLITLERTACYGMCPIYKLTISADGTVVFEGIRFVKKPGIAKSGVSQEQIRELLDAFEKINYFELRDRYERPEDGCTQWLTDHPSAITSISLRGKSKSVSHYHGCRGPEVLKELEKLEQAIDKSVNTEQWIR